MFITALYSVPCDCEQTLIIHLTCNASHLCIHTFVFKVVNNSSRDSIETVEQNIDIKEKEEKKKEKKEEEEEENMELKQVDTVNNVIETNSDKDGEEVEGESPLQLDISPENSNSRLTIIHNVHVHLCSYCSCSHKQVLSTVCSVCIVHFKILHDYKCFLYYYPLELIVTLV